jgi:predicted DNA-binding protein (MmcQ/YjbR family)
MTNEGPTENMRRLEAIALDLPEAGRVDIEAWDGQPTFRVRGKNFVFTNPAVSRLTVKLPPDEAAAVLASDPTATPAGYGLGRHGWVVLALAADEPAPRWEEIGEWVRASYRLVAPRPLARQVMEPS